MNNNNIHWLPCGLATVNTWERWKWINKHFICPKAIIITELFGMSHKKVWQDMESINQCMYALGTASLSLDQPALLLKPA